MVVWWVIFEVENFAEEAKLNFNLKSGYFKCLC